MTRSKNEQDKKVRYKARCLECPEVWPNPNIKKPGRDSLRSWRIRHMIRTGHSVQTAATYVRTYTVGGK